MGFVFRRKGSRIYTAEWTSADGARRRRSTRTSDKEAALEILAHLEVSEARVRAGVITAGEARRSTADRLSIGRHLDDYITWCRETKQAKRAVDQKGSHLRALVAEEGISRLPELTAERITHNLATFGAERSARTVNFRRQHVAAVLSWARETGRTDINPMPAVPRQDEHRSRRRVRRALTDAEAAALLRIGRERGRWLWYALALYAGLRKGDLRRLRWSDIDLEARTLTVREGKARRVDILPLHPALAAELERLRPLSIHPSTSMVFDHVVTDATRLRDFQLAGLARRVVVTDDDGEPVMIGKGKRERPKTKIVAEDETGRVVDLHALRATLGTMLARQGVTPQVAQRIMRHSDYRTTLKHYTSLTLSDSTAAIDRINLPAQEIAQATGTDGAAASEAGDNEIDQRQQTIGDGPCRTALGHLDPNRPLSGGDAKHVGPAEWRTSASGDDGCRPVSSKRATRLERATFSLEG